MRCVGDGPTSRARGRRRPNHRQGVADERGAILILALVYIIVIGVIVAALSTWALNGLHNTTQFNSARTTDYAASSSTEVAINSIRTTPIAASLNASPPTICWGIGASSTLVTDNISMSSWCSTVQNLASPATRIVTISTCRSAVTAKNCGLDPFLQAVVTYDDYPAGGGPLLSSQCSSTCGDGAILNAWNWAPGVGINSISFTSTSPAVAIVGGATYIPAATATSNLKVSITLDAASVGCAISNGGVVSFTGVGTCIIDANQPGNSYYYVAATQVQQSITVVSLGVTQLAAGSETTNASAVSTSTNVTAPVGPKDIIAVAFEGATSQSCASAVGSGLNVYTPVTSVGWYSAGGSFFGMCEYSATGTASAGPVTVNFTGPTTYASIEVVEISGYNNTAIGLDVASQGGSNSAPMTNLGGTPTGQSDEVIFGDLTNVSAAPPTWSGSSPSGFTLNLTNVVTQGANTFSSAIYFGPAASSLTGSLSGNAHWGTIGTEIKP